VFRTFDYLIFNYYSIFIGHLTLTLKMFSYENTPHLEARHSYCLSTFNTW